MLNQLLFVKHWLRVIMLKEKCFLLGILFFIGFFFSNCVFADLAERMPISQTAISDDLVPESGDVVAIDRGGFIHRSKMPNSPLVVGVVSTKPAHVLRNMIQQSVPVALSGIVPCKVINENGMIRPGDLLVSSSRPGYAMRTTSEIVPGTVIGKALDEQDEPVDSVLMLAMNR